MAKKQLLVNMIYGGSFHRADTVLDEEEIPLNLRRPEYLRDPVKAKRLIEEISVEDDLEGLEEEELEGLEEEEAPPPKKKVFKRK